MISYNDYYFSVELRPSFSIPVKTGNVLLRVMHKKQICAKVTLWRILNNPFSNMPLQSYKLQVKLRKSGSEEGIRVGKLDQWEIILIAQVWGHEFKSKASTEKSSNV